MCEICNGLPNCPVCSETKDTAICPICLGKKEIRYNDSGDVDNDGWIIDDCEECNGTGEIEI